MISQSFKAKIFGAICDSSFCFHLYPVSNLDLSAVICSFHVYLLRTSYVPGTNLGLEEISVKKADKVLALMELMFWLGNVGSK